MTTSGRKYAPVWEELKLYGTVSVRVNDTVAHKRIVKAIVNEKYRDEAFKAKYRRQHMTVRLSWRVSKIDSRVLVFELNYYGA